MAEFNHDRALVALLREICAERGIQLTEFSAGWLLCLQRAGRTAYVFGYDFGLNNAAARLIAKDKAATSDLLAFHQVACVEHRIFHSPQLAAYVPMEGNWPRMIAYFEEHGRDVVCKPNEGTGGQGVTRARTLLELEKAVLSLFRQHRSLCLSPYVEIAAEYRVAMLGGRCEFLFRKERFALCGDGRSSVRELVATPLSAQPDPALLQNLAADLSIMTADELNRRPAEGERVELNWRHNLGLGAAPVLLDAAAPGSRAIVELAQQAVRALGIELASVDVVETGAGAKILEINCGIMMESFARVSPEHRALARRFYDKIVGALIGEEAGSP